MDNEKPHLVLEWNDDVTDATGWVVVHRFVQGYASGGTRMHPAVTRREVERLAKVMAYKYEAGGSVTTGGCKAGIAYDYKAPEAKAVLGRFLRAMGPYLQNGVSLGGDLGVAFEDVLAIMEELQVDLITPRMKENPHVMEGLQAYRRLLAETVDGKFLLNDAVTGYGTAYCADEGWRILQKRANKKGGAGAGAETGARVVVQGFGCVGASCAFLLHKLGYRVVGIADANLLVENPVGLDVPALVQGRQKHGELAPGSFRPEDRVRSNSEWLEVECDILIPAALENVIHGGNAHRVKGELMVEGANIPVSPEGDTVLKKKGVHVVNDFVANLGAIRFYDAAIFGHVRSGAAEVLADIETLCRSNTSRLLVEAERQGLYEREAAERLFRPRQ
ncbi:MAG: Glu/Leu/Phe/Val dehydrogenase [Paenibacillaceae bacterium]|jgi:glutamate dehydrogenase (NAD(P)+)|nr:Glu/Leu/Phe/Val dehydrogenase [Paenibacillaceae bacterium]